MESKRINLICADCNKIIAHWEAGDEKGRLLAENVYHECREQRLANRRAQARERRAKAVRS